MGIQLNMELFQELHQPADNKITGTHSLLDLGLNPKQGNEQTPEAAATPCTSDATDAAG